MTELDMALARCGARLVAPVAQTGLAQVYRVETGGHPAILKLYTRGHPGNEGSGPALMAAWANTRAMVRIHQADPGYVLMDLLDGPSLGDLARAGDHVTADIQLAACARRLHDRRPLGVAGLTPLRDCLAPLFAVAFAPSCPPALRSAVAQSQALARHLLDTTVMAVPLHGDLHHDNVILTTAGPVAFDAKGVCGDPAFELANALRHPRGLPDRQRDPERIKSGIARFACALRVPPVRLAQWAAVKCAHSIALRAAGPLVQDAESDLLTVLLSHKG